MTVPHHTRLHSHFTFSRAIALSGEMLRRFYDSLEILGLDPTSTPSAYFGTRILLSARVAKLARNHWLTKAFRERGKAWYRENAGTLNNYIGWSV